MTAPDDFCAPDSKTWQTKISELSSTQARELAKRARTAPLFAHAYSFHLNFRFGNMMPIDLLDFAAKHGLCGVKIHVEDGEENSLFSSPDMRMDFAAKARDLNLIVHIETSETTQQGLANAIEIARATNATSVRCYPRYEARVSKIIAKTIADLKTLQAIDPKGLLRFTLEQHEDLKSSELVQIIKAVDNPNLSLLFDFGNMINAYERPLDALAIQGPEITEVHIKDCLISTDRGGWAQTGCTSGTGHLPFAELLLGLLLLGKDQPQVTAFALEEEVDYFAPAMRFPNEEADPLIQFRSASLTPIDEERMTLRLVREHDEATTQISTVRALLSQFETAAMQVADPKMKAR